MILNTSCSVTPATLLHALYYYFPSVQNSGLLIAFSTLQLNFRVSYKISSCPNIYERTFSFPLKCMYRYTVNCMFIRLSTRISTHTAGSRRVITRISATLAISRCLERKRVRMSVDG